MAKQFLISTTGAGTVVIDDLGARGFLHPTVSLDLTQEYTLEEIRDSADLRAAIIAGDLTAVFDTAAITDATTFDNHLIDFDRVQTITNTADILTNANAIAALDSAGRLGEVLDYVDNTAVPPTEVLGDRYILDDTGASNAAWDGAAALDLVEFDGAVWVVKTVASGNNTYVIGETQDRIFVDDGSPAWEPRPTSITQTAVQVPYTPTTAADWDVVPTEVGGALDETVSRIEDLENATPPASKKSYTFAAGDDKDLKGSKDLERVGKTRTNVTPFIAPITGTLWGITIASKQGTNATYDVQIIVNGVGVHTQNIVATDKGFNNTLALAVTAGDEVRIRFIKLAANIKDLGVEVYGVEA